MTGNTTGSALSSMNLQAEVRWIYIMEMPINTMPTRDLPVWSPVAKIVLMSSW